MYNLFFRHSSEQTRTFLTTDTLCDTNHGPVPKATQREDVPTRSHHLSVGPISGSNWAARDPDHQRVEPADLTVFVVVDLPLSFFSVFLFQPLYSTMTYAVGGVKNRLLVCPPPPLLVMPFIFFGVSSRKSFTENVLTNVQTHKKQVLGFV